MSDVEEVTEPAVPTCPQCGAPNYSPDNDQAEHAYTCSMAPVAQIQPEASAPELAATPSDGPAPEPVPEQVDEQPVE